MSISVTLPANLQDTVALLAIITGINTGTLIILLLALIFGPSRKKPRPRPAGITQDLDDGAPPLVHAAMAMGTLCAAVHRHDPKWEAIQIARTGEGQASMKITMESGKEIDAPSGKVDTSKLN